VSHYEIRPLALVYFNLLLSRGVLLSMVCLKCVIVEPRINETALAPRGCRAMGGGMRLYRIY
jgi:hypothetical protein